MTPQPAIAFVVPQGAQLFYPEVTHRHGGAEVQFALLARELARRGEVRPVVLLGRYGQPERGEIDSVQLESFAHRPGLPGRFSFWRALARAHPSAVVQRATGSMTANTAFYSMFTRTPFIYWVAADYDCAPDPTPNLDYPKTRPRSFDWGVRRATAIVAQHAGQLPLLESYQHRTAATVIPNGWPSQPMPDAPRTHHLWIGHATLHKNPDALLQLAAVAPGEQFLMLMPPDRAHPQIEAEILRRAQQLPNVEIRPRVPFSEMGALYAHAKTLIITSLAEGFPNTLLQALWNGTPVLSLHVDPGAILMKNNIGFCAAGDLNALIAHFKRLNADPAVWQTTSQRAYAHAAAELSIARVADRFTQLLRAMKILK